MRAPSILFLWGMTLGLSGCDTLWSGLLTADPRNCIRNPAACSAGEICDTVTEACVRPHGIADLGDDLRNPPPLACPRPGYTQPGSPIRFSPATLPFSVPNGEAVAVGDFNKDSFKDLLITSGATGTLHNEVTRLYGRKDCSFESRGVLTVDPYAAWIISADMNLDSNPDFVVAHRSNNQLAVWLGNGGDQFLLAPMSPYTLASPLHLIGAGSLIGESTPDVMVCTDGDLLILPGLGNGALQVNMMRTLPTRSQGPAIGDVNGDGLVDLVADLNFLPGGLQIQLGSISGMLLPGPILPASGEIKSVVIADVNGDLTPDLAATSQVPNQVSVWLGTGMGTFATRVDYSLPFAPDEIVAADFNGDNLRDLAVAGSDRGIAILRSTAPAGSMILQSQMELPLAPVPMLAVGDFNQDGKPDLVAPTGDTVSILYNIVP